MGPRRVCEKLQNSGTHWKLTIAMHGGLLYKLPSPRVRALGLGTRLHAHRPVILYCEKAAKNVIKGWLYPLANGVELYFEFRGVSFLFCGSIFRTKYISFSTFRTSCRKRTDACVCRRTPHETQDSETAWLCETGKERCAGLSLFLRQQWRLTSDSREDRQVQETASAETVAYWTETVLDYDRGCHRKRHVQVHYTCL